MDSPQRILRRQTRSSTLDSAAAARKPSESAKKRYNVISNLKKHIGKRKPSATAHQHVTVADNPAGIEDVAGILATSFEQSAPRKEAYDNVRISLRQQEAKSLWDRRVRDSASECEKRAANIILKIREHEREDLFGNLASESLPAPDKLDMGGQFLTNLNRIKQSDIYKIALRMPKGAHQHLHLNTEIPPHKLVEKARDVPNMCIRSTRPILTAEDVDATEIVFNVMPEETETVDLFSPDYQPEFKAPGSKPWMNWRKFCEDFKAKDYCNGDPEDWIISKMVLSEDEVYGKQQTTNGIWARFNQGTRAFKGLLNYESIFRWYFDAAIDHMIEDRVMYAELRPMLLDKSIPSDDGKRQVTHDDQMKIILEEVAKKQRELDAQGKLDMFPFGVKIIYCTPRSIPKKLMERELQDCLKLKLKYPDLICGFDLVGAEDRPNHIGFYLEELCAFQQACENLGIEIPFLFHAGETLLDRGGSRDPANSNLYDAVALKAKRIGHGFSLLKHPELIESFRNLPICIELCPTSNELLHLVRNIKEHPFPLLLALGIPCTVNSDNPSLFSSSLTLEFYQVMVGSTTMSLYGWHQLAEWSLEHSCLSAEDRDKAKKIFSKDWEEFCWWVVEEYGAYAEKLNIVVPPA